MPGRLWESPDPKVSKKECATCGKLLGKNHFSNEQWKKVGRVCKECVPKGAVMESTHDLDADQLVEFSFRSHPVANDTTLSFSLRLQQPVPKLNEKNFCVDESRKSKPYQQIPPVPLKKENMKGYHKGSKDTCCTLSLGFLTGNKITTSALDGRYASVNMANNDIQPDYHLQRVKGTDFFTLMRKGDTGMFLVACSIFSGDGIAYEHYFAYDGWRGLLYEPLNNELVALEEKDVASGKAATTRFVRIRDALRIKHFGGVYQLWKKK